MSGIKLPIILIDNGHGKDTPGKCSPDASLEGIPCLRPAVYRLFNLELSTGSQIEEKISSSIVEINKQLNSRIRQAVQL